MQIAGNKIIVQLTALSRMLLLSSLSSCKFTMLHTEHPLAEAIYENDLIDEKHLAELFQRIKDAEVGDVLELTIDDEILIYTSMDITCKSFLTNIADDLQERTHDFVQATEANFSDVRTTLLQGCQIVMEGMKKTFSGDRKFMERVNFLDAELHVE